MHSWHEYKKKYIYMYIYYIYIYITWRLSINKISLHNKYITIYRSSHLTLWISTSSHTTKFHIFENLSCVGGLKTCFKRTRLAKEIQAPHTQRGYGPYSPGHNNIFYIQINFLFFSFILKITLEYLPILLWFLSVDIFFQNITWTSIASNITSKNF